MPHVSGNVQHLFFCVHEHRESFHLFRTSLTFFSAVFCSFCCASLSLLWPHLFLLYSFGCYQEWNRAPHPFFMYQDCISLLNFIFEPSQLDLSRASKLHFSLCPLPIRIPRGLFLHIRWFPSAGNQSAQRSNSPPSLLNWWNPAGHTRSQSLTLGTEVPRSECLEKPQTPLKILLTVPWVSRTYEKGSWPHTLRFQVVQLPMTNLKANRKNLN